MSFFSSRQYDMHCSVKYCCSNSSIPGVILHLWNPLKHQTTQLIIEVHFDPWKYEFADCTILGDFAYISYLCLFNFILIELRNRNWTTSLLHQLQLKRSGSTSVYIVQLLFSFHSIWFRKRINVKKFQKMLELILPNN